MEFVRVEPIGQEIVVVTLKRPPVNATTQQMYGEIRDAFRGIGDRDRVVVLTGAGKYFCAGNDLHEFVTMNPDNAPERMLAIREAYWAVYDCPVPVIAAVNGAARGAGLALAACCDLILASTDATFGLPEINVGVLGGARHAARLVPELLMRRMFLTGEPVGADVLVQHGSILELVEQERLMDRALELAETIAAKSPTGVRMAKASLNETEWLPLKPGYELEQEHLITLSGHVDAKEAVLAVIEKRSPRFTD